MLRTRCARFSTLLFGFSIWAGVMVWEPCPGCTGILTLNRPACQRQLILKPVNSSNGGHQYLSHIDGLRALAIIPVVVYHLFPVLCPGGFAGVDIFFVISGYSSYEVCGTNNSKCSIIPNQLSSQTAFIMFDSA